MENKSLERDLAKEKLCYEHRIEELTNRLDAARNQLKQVKMEKTEQFETLNEEYRMSIAHFTRQFETIRQEEIEDFDLPFFLNELNIAANRGFSKELIKFTKEKVKIELRQNHDCVQ